MEEEEEEEEGLVSHLARVHHCIDAREMTPWEDVLSDEITTVAVGLVPVMPLQKGEDLESREI